MMGRHHAHIPAVKKGTGLGQDMLVPIKAGEEALLVTVITLWLEMSSLGRKARKQPSFGISMCLIRN